MNPQYHLSLQKSTTVFVMLTQPEIRAKERKQYHHIGFYIIKALGKYFHSFSNLKTKLQREFHFLRMKSFMDTSLSIHEMVRRWKLV